jgi:ABC-type branched-subunit amino acid transport system ATPase component
MRAEEAELAARARDALDFVGFAEFADRPGTRCLRTRRIVEIARTLIGDPKIVLLDEPGRGLSINRVAEPISFCAGSATRRGYTRHDRACDPACHGSFGSCRGA